MPSGKSMYLDLKAEKGLIETIRLDTLDMNRIANTAGNMISSDNGDIFIMRDIQKATANITDRTVDKCGNDDVKCLESFSAEFTLDREVDDTYILDQCRLENLQGLTEETIQSQLLKVQEDYSDSLMTQQANEHLAKVKTAVGTEFSNPNGETTPRGIVEDMLLQLENDTGFSRTSFTVLLSNTFSSILRKEGFGCCELFGQSIDPTNNVWGAGEVYQVPANIMPSNTNVIVYLKQYTGFKYNCKWSEIYEGMDTKTKGWLVHQYQETFGSRAFNETDFPRIGKLGYFYFDAQPPIATSTSAPTPALNQTSAEVEKKLSLEDDLTKYSKDELLRLSEQLGIEEAKTSLNKSELIEILEKHEEVEEVETI